MIYVENDFYSNFNGAVKSNDEATIESMLIDQLSTIIAKRRGEVIELMQKVKIPLSANPTNEEIANAIVVNLKKNTKLRAGLAYLIAKQNNILSVSEKASRANGDEKKEGEEKDSKESKEIDWNKTADTVTSIATTISMLADSLTGDRGNNFQKELQNQSNVKAPNYSASAYGYNKPQPKKKSKRWIWYVAGAVVLVGVGYYGYKKGWFSGKGGDVATPEV